MSRKEMEVSNLVACSTHRQKGTQKLTLKAASGGLLRSRKYSESLQNPRTANISKNRLYYYFDDFDNTNV